MANQDIITKVCSRCGIDKPLSEYQKDKSRKLGVQKYCKECRYLQFLEIKDTQHYKSKRKEYNAKRTEYHAKYREANRDKVNELSRNWSANNKEKRAIISLTYGGKRRSILKTGDKFNKIKNWIKSQIKICYWCGVDCDNGYHVDHYVPLAKGGTHTIDNFVISCPSCNVRKNTKDPYEFAKTKGRLF